MASDLCEQYLRTAPANAVAILVLGLVAKKRLQIEDAIPLLEQSVRIAPGAKALASLADCLWRVGRLEEGLGYVERVIAGSPDNLEALLLMAAILHGLRRFEEALKCIRRAERIAPQSHLVAARLGCILGELRQYEAAENYFRAAARMTPGFPHCGLVNFDASVWRQIAPQSSRVALDEFAPLRVADVQSPYDAVVVACCDSRYFYKYGVTFANSYAQNASNGNLLHLHIVDPDDGLAAYLEILLARLALRNVVVTYEYAPVDEAPDFNQRRTFYSCARFLRMGALLAHYRKPVACFDIDTVFEAPLGAMLAGLGDADVGLVRREPPDSPWLDIVANVVVARYTRQTLRYFDAVENFIRHFVGREKLFWHLDQIALYCVLKMMERFDLPPQVAPIAQSAGAVVWHIGNPYAYRLNEHRVTRYRLDGLARPPTLP